MKKTIAKLRLAGIASFIVYFVLVFTRPSEPFQFRFDQAEQASIFISFACFAAVFLLQLYRLYIASYQQDEEEGN